MNRYKIIFAVSIFFISSVVQGFLHIDRDVQNFQPSSSVSSFTNSNFSLEGAITLDIKSGLISSSINGDMFSKLEFFSTAIEFRGCDCGKSPNQNEIKSYVDKQFKGLPEEMKNEITKVMVDFRNAEEKLRTKMFNPKLQDDEVLIYGQEREKLINNEWEMEFELINIYVKIVKPFAYSKYLSHIQLLELEKYFELLDDSVNLDQLEVLIKKNLGLTFDQYESIVYGDDFEQNYEVRKQEYIRLLSSEVEREITNKSNIMEDYSEMELVIGKFYKYLEKIQ